MAQVEKLRRKYPSDYTKKNPAKRLAAIAKLAFEIIPADPELSDYRQGTTLSRFIPSAGYSSAVSKAKSIAIRLKQAVFLVLNSKTAEHNESEEKREQIEYIFRNLGKSDQVNVFLFEPEIEVIFFESEKVREKLHRMSPRTNFFYPRQLIRSIGNKSRLIDKLDNGDIESLRKETSLKELIRLCSENTDKKEREK